MAKKFMDLEEAAKALGVSPEALNEMRDRREIYAYRDGGNWKFKTEDVEKFVAERAEGGSAPGEMDDDLDSILLSDVELGQSAGTSSTIIGKSNEPGSDIEIGKSPKSSGASDVRLASDSDVLGSGSGLSKKFSDMDALDLELPASGSGIGLSSSSLKLSSHDDLSLDDQNLELGEESRSKPGSSKLGGSGLDLAGDDDGDLVLGGSGPGSDVTRSASDSGISLIDPADSGLSLEEAPLELGGSAVESLEFGDDDMILLEEEGDSEGATQLKTDDDFLLSPLEEAGVDESDSGSQVIALDSEADFDESAATMLGSKTPAMHAMLEEDMGGPSLGGRGGLAPGGNFAAGAAMMSAPQAVEAPFSIWVVLFLALIVIFMLITGMMMYDLMRNMWSWNGAYSVNSTLMDSVLTWFEK